jgi:microcystin-dependent protein
MDYYLGQIILFAGNYAPDGWLPCNGQLVSMNTYQALYSLIGFTYGGSGTQFQLPDLRGRVPVSTAPLQTPPLKLGNVVGTETVTLTQAQVPAHTHAVTATTAAATTNVPTGNLLAKVPDGQVFYLDPPDPVPSGVTITTVPLASDAVQSVFGGQSHNNMMPSLVLNYLICTQGIYPTPS